MFYQNQRPSNALQNATPINNLGLPNDSKRKIPLPTSYLIILILFLIFLIGGSAYILSQKSAPKQFDEIFQVTVKPTNTVITLFPPIPSTSNAKNVDNIYFCEKESDCIKTSGCCGCSMGGGEIAINKNYLTLWRKSLNCEPDGICTANYTCTAKVPKCINSKCTLPPITITVYQTLPKSNWKTYTLAEWWSFSIQYPNNWIVNKNTAEPIFVNFSKNAPENTADFINVKIYRNSDENMMSVEDIKSEYINDGKYNLLAQDININGKTGYLFDLNDNTGQFVVLFERIQNNIPTIIYYLRLEYNPNNKEEARQIFQNMLETFKTN